LYEKDVIIKLGKCEKVNVYALNNNNGSNISEKLPSFNDTSKVEDFKHHAFDLAFPKYSDEWDKFIELDSADPDETSITESVDALVCLPFIKQVSEDV
jgi:hypothetical protein